MSDTDSEPLPEPESKPPHSHAHHSHHDCPGGEECYVIHHPEDSIVHRLKHVPRNVTVNPFEDAPEPAPKRNLLEFSNFGWDRDSDSSKVCRNLILIIQ